MDWTELYVIAGIILGIEGMKVANTERDLSSEATAYNEEFFQSKAEELRNVVYCPNEQL